MESGGNPGRLARFRTLPPAVRAQKLRTRLVGNVLGRLYIDLNHDIDSSLLVSGTPRSGSTWLAELLNQSLRYRLIFEPLRHGSGEVKTFEAKYLRPDDVEPVLQRRLEQLLTGTTRDPTLDSRNRRALARGRLVKGVSTNLLLGWFEQQFPTVPVVYIVRDPLLVVSSYMNMSWLTPKAAAHWLSQEKLMADHLDPFRSSIESADTRLKQSALEWCVLNYVPMRQSESTNWIMVRYGELLEDPQGALTNVVKRLGKWEEGMQWKRINVPSHTAESAVSDRASLADKWRSRLSGTDRRDVERYVREFGFDEYLTV